MTESVLNTQIKKLVHEFSLKEQLTSDQEQQFYDYFQLLQEWNQKMNLTAINDPKEVIQQHFFDSLMIDRFIDFSSIKTIADIGTGAGFPALPLKIKYPHLSVVLIEVNQKKIDFLQTVINSLHLQHVEIAAIDWRTFLRKTCYSIDIFLTRAALAPKELVRMFAPSCCYNKSMLIYWASKEWNADVKDQYYVENQVYYRVSNKMRKFVFFKKGVIDD